MRRRLLTALFTHFGADFSARFPRFEPVEDDGVPDLGEYSDPELLPESDLHWGDLWIWRWQTAQALTLFVALQAHHDRDRFTVEIAWSVSGQFPWGAFARRIGRPEGRRRLGGVFKGDDHWWHLDPAYEAAWQRYMDDWRTGGAGLHATPVDELLPRVQSQLADAIDKVASHGLPYLQLAARGLGLTITGSGHDA
jgi:hypothetical protein